MILGGFPQKRRVYLHGIDLPLLVTSNGENFVTVEEEEVNMIFESPQRLSIVQSMTILQLLPNKDQSLLVGSKLVLIVAPLLSPK